MSAPTRSTGDPGSPRRLRVTAGVVALLALVTASLLAGPPTEDTPLDPRSAGPDGLRGLVEIAEAMGAQVDISSDRPSDTTTHLLLTRDRLGPAQRDRIEDWVRAGGRLVVTDPASPLHGLEAAGQPVADMVGPSARVPGCALDALDDVGPVRHAGWTAYEVPEPDVGCFVDNGAAWLVARDLGDGSLLALGSTGPLVNRALARDDNAVLAAALLFPTAEAHLQVLPPDLAAPGQVGIADLLPDRLLASLAVALLAVVVSLVAIGRRLGAPVEESLPPTVPSAELARSVGDLLQRAGTRDGAAARLRGEAREDAARVLGSGHEPERLAEQVHHRLDVDLDTARRAILDLPVEDDDGLVAVATAVTTVRDRLRVAS